MRDFTLAMRSDDSWHRRQRSKVISNDPAEHLCVFAHQDIDAGVSVLGSSPGNLLPHPICPNGVHAGASGQGNKSEGGNVH